MTLILALSGVRQEDCPKCEASMGYMMVSGQPGLQKRIVLKKTKGREGSLKRRKEGREKRKEERKKRPKPTRL